VPFDQLNRRFIDMKKVTNSVGQEAEYDFKVTLDNFNHRFIIHPNRILGWSRGRK